MFKRFLKIYRQRRIRNSRSGGRVPWVSFSDSTCFRVIRDPGFFYRALALNFLLSLWAVGDGKWLGARQKESTKSWG